MLVFEERYGFSKEKMGFNKVGNQKNDYRLEFSLNAYKYKYEIGDCIIDENKEIVITHKQKINKGSFNRTYFRFKCKKCGYDCSNSYVRGEYKEYIWYTSSQINRSIKCPCCGGNNTVSPLINSIAKLRPDLIEYFVNKEDSYKYSVYSNKKVMLRCINCNEKKNMIISNFIKSGFSCPVCSDKFSIGEKIMYSVLKSLHINFIKEMTNTTFTWCNNKRYDFYIEKYNMIIEINGKQHYDGGFETYGGRCLEEEQYIDDIKYNLAIKNGIKEYIKIDAYKSDFEYIKNSIINSKLSEIIDISKINWDGIMDFVYNHTLVKDICKYWNENNDCKRNYVCKLYNISNNTLSCYLKIGNRLKWCEYDNSGKNEHLYNPFENDAHDRSHPIKCNENNIFFKSIPLCAKNSFQVFGLQIGDSTIRFKVNNPLCENRINYTFSYISKEEFNEAIKNGFKCYGTAFNI